MAVGFELAPLYQFRMSDLAFARIVHEGPMWNHVATPFLTPRNFDPLKKLEGTNGNFYVSNDGGVWWFVLPYIPTKFGVIKDIAYRLNKADPWIERIGLEPVARIIEPGVASIEWPKSEEVEEVAYKSVREETRVLDMREAWIAGYRFHDASSFPSPSNHQVHLPMNQWIDNPKKWTLNYEAHKPIEPEEPEEPPIDDSKHSQWVVDHATWVVNHAAWVIAFAVWNDARSSWQIWQDWVLDDRTCLMKDGRVHRIFVAQQLTHEDESFFAECWLAPFYNGQDEFIKWGAVQEHRVVFEYEDGTQHKSKWVADGTAILGPLELWNNKQIHKIRELPNTLSFDWRIDPKLQGPYHG